MPMISHESPLCLLQESLQYNDYDYALVHLFESNEEYYNFFKESLKNGRHVLLDNSLFELKTEFNKDEFIHWIKKLQPTEYIIPDAWMDKDRTIANIKEWAETNHDLPGKTIGVVQAKTKKEFIECYEQIVDLVDKVAFTFMYPFLLPADLSEHCHPRIKALNYMTGRVTLMDELTREGIIRYDKPHHLLGCFLPQEFANYRHCYWVETIDTSNPVLHGICGIKYKSFGMTYKKNVLLADLLNCQKQDIDMDIVNYNIKKFRQFVKGD